MFILKRIVRNADVMVESNMAAENARVFVASGKMLNST